MSERDSTSESGGLNIVLTPDEKRVFGQLFQAADSENLGVVTGELAVKFFEKSGLNPRILGEIWGIADTENRGLLTKVGFSVALRLIGQAQAGLHPRPELALNPGHLPRFEGLNITYPTPQAPPTTASPPPPTQATPGPPAIVRVPQLTDADCRRFTELFQVSGAVNGILPGDIARGIFQRSRLPNQTLGLIWNLADRQQRGALGAAEFVVAMHLINCCKNGSLQALPSVLPPALYEAASGRPAMKTGPGPRGPAGRGGPSIPAVPPIPKQFSGPGVRAQSPLSRQFTPPNPINPTISGTIPSQTTGEWAVSPREKAEFDGLFASVDKGVKGYITGEEAVPFFSNSKLPEDVLAQIWDLADIHKAGRLSQDEFAVAMYLIRQQRSRRDGKGLPDTLPPNLIPPSMRHQLGVNNTLPPATSQNVPASSSAMNELFGLDAFTSPQPSTTDGQAGMSAFNAFDSNDVFGLQQKPSSPPSASSRVSPPPVNSMFAPPQPRFVPQSNFGQTLMSSGTGGSTSSATRPTPSAMEDLLGDGDPEVSKKLTPDTTELANLSNQIGQLTMQTQELKNKRASAEQELNAFTSQKHDIELRLSQIRSLYEREAKDVKSVEDRLSASRLETTRLRQEYSVIEANYNELQAQRQEVASQLEADQRENLDLKERMRLINAENLQLRQKLEKLKSEARQHKGLVAISKKQLATSEGERDRLKSEIDELRSATVHSQVASPTPGSPTLSQASISTNPFYRRSPPAAPESAFSPSPFSPNAAGPSQSSYDDVFGPSFGNAASGPAPPISFGKQVQVNPPTSIHEGGFSSRPDTPNTHWTTQSVDSSSRERDLFQKPEDRRASISVKSDAGTESSKVAGTSTLQDKRNEDNKSPFAPVTLERNITGTTSGGDEFKKPGEKRDSFSGFPPSLSSGIPGAYPSPIKPTATGESTRSRASNMSKPEVTFASTVRSDPFSLGKEENRAPSASKEDMDAAFGSFVLPSLRHQERQNTGGSGMSSSKINLEFPPIEEINKDDDSDSDIGTTGFEDNFAPPSPVQARSTLPGSVPPTTGAPPGSGPNDFGSKPGTPLPPANAQQPPPTYNSVVSPIPGSAAEKSHYPAEFRGLLPSRSDPMSHEAMTPGGSTNAVLQGSISPTSSPPPPSSIFGGAIPTSSQPSNIFSSSPSTSKTKEGPADEFDDDAFGDLEAAKEIDGKGDEHDFGVLAAHDSFDEFNPVFDSPDSKPNASATTATSGKGAAQTDFDEEFTRFNFNIDTPAPAQHQQNTGQSSASAPIHTASSQDWDAIFDGLEGQSNTNQQTAASEGKGQTSGNVAATSNDIGGPSNGASLDITNKQSERVH